MAKKVRVCVSPALYDLYKEPGQITVVVDILRATSAICTALDHGIAAVIPVSTIDEAKAYRGEEFILAAERGGEKVQGFKYGNSPLDYIDNPEVVGKTLVLTTTNGTLAIEAAKNEGNLVIGSFSNLKVLNAWLVEQPSDVMILCAGWKNRINLEDTIFSGAVVNYLLDHGFEMDIDSDAAIIANVLYEKSKQDLKGFLKISSHRNRLHKLQLEADINYCLRCDTTTVIPMLQDGKLVNIMLQEMASL